MDFKVTPTKETFKGKRANNYLTLTVSQFQVYQPHPNTTSQKHGASRPFLLFPSPAGLAFS